MTDTPPLTADQVDELLSAELDGEFDAAARDLGFDPADARARLTTDVPGIDDRRAALAAARDALAKPPPVDDLVMARVRAKAMKAAAVEHDAGQASRAHRLRRVSAVAGGLAAAVAVIAGLAFAMQGTNGSSNKSSNVAAPYAGARSSTPAAAAGATTGTAPTANFGIVTDVPALVAQARAQALSYDATSVAGSENAKTQNKRAGSDSVLFARSCDGAATQLSGVPNPTLRGVATLSGKPVLVFLFRKGADEIVVVLRDDCRLVTQQTLPAPSG